MKKLLLMALLLSFLGSCTTEEQDNEIERNNRKNILSEGLTATPEPTPTEAAIPTKGVPTPRPTATGTPTPTPTMVPYAVAEEILSAEEFSGKVQIADTVLQLPCKLKEIMAISDIAVEQSPYASISGYDPLNDTYAAESRNTLLLTFADGSEARLTVENKENRSLPIGELYVTELVSESPCIFFPKGISVGTHCSILKEWREHDSLVSGSYVACYKYQEAEQMRDYGAALDIGAVFEMDVNNTTYNIDEVRYTPTFYVSMDYMTNMVQSYYPKDLSYHVPIVLSKSWQTGLIVHEGRRFAVTLEESWMFDSPQTVEELLAELGRELQYCDEEWDAWYFYTDTSDTTNEKIVVKEEEALTSVVNFWDFSDFAGVDSITLDGKKVRPDDDKWKAFADVAVMSGGYIDLWRFELEALDQGEIPEEVRTIFRDVVLTMAKSVEEVEE